MGNFRFPPIKLVPHTSKTGNGSQKPFGYQIDNQTFSVSGFSLAWLTTDFCGKTAFHETLPESSREPSSGVIGLCSIFYLVGPLNLNFPFQISHNLISISIQPLGSLDAMRRRTFEVSHPHKAQETIFTPHNSEFEAILSEIYQSCREYEVRYCVLTDRNDSKVIELFRDSYMDHHSPYDIILLSDNDHRSVPLTLGGLLWDVLLSICHDVRDSLSMNG